MLRQALLTGFLVLAATGSGSGQEWARKMFDVTSHDFGAVARGSKVEYRFTVTNLYVEDVHISGVRSSCGCTSPTITKQTLKTYETSEIVATFNTRTFLGQKSATLTVTFSKPFPAEAQLHVKGYIRSDVVLDPSSVDFGTISTGAGQEQTVDIQYAGRDSWELREVKSASPYLDAELIPKERAAGRVGYSLVVRLKDNAPAGYLREQLTLLTNDAKAPEFPVIVEARIEAALSVSPSPLVLGVIEPGQTITKKLVVRGKQPFKITGIVCEDDCLAVETSDESKPVHLIPVTFQAGAEPGKFEAVIHVHTDLAQGGDIDISALAEVGASAVKK